MIDFVVDTLLWLILGVGKWMARKLLRMDDSTDVLHSALGIVFWLAIVAAIVFAVQNG